MYEIHLITEQRERYLPLLGLAALPQDGALFVMHEHGADCCAAFVKMDETGCTLQALGQNGSAPAENVDVLLEWVCFKYAPFFTRLDADVPDAQAALLPLHGFIKDEDGAYFRPLSLGCKCKDAQK